MRLKEDKDSWNASNIIRKTVEVPEEPKKKPARKNTRRWCKGKRGVEHQFELFDEYRVAGWGIKIESCTKCGKKRWSHKVTG